jgi:hypothetical protein
MTTSLKASTKAVKAPSKVETVLSDAVKLALSSVAGEATKAFELYAKQQDASVAYETSETKLASEFYTWLYNAKPDYGTFHSVRKHIVSTISESKGRKFETIEKWFNSYVIKAVKALGYELPKAESKAAEGMAKKRAELAKIDNATLEKQITELRKASDKASLKQALTLANERDKRELQAKNAIKKNETKATTELKTMLKKWVSGMGATELATLVYAKNNFNEVTKLLNQAK